MIEKKDILDLPSTFGVYIFQNDKEIIYIGKSVNIKARVSSHLESAKLSRKESLIIKNSSRLKYIVTGSEFEALILESELISKHKPKYNIRWRDDKSYLYIKLTADEEFPKILTSRRENEKGCIYYGPFSSSREVKDLIMDVRKIVPFCTEKKTSKTSCFYSKIKLCDPCPNKISLIDDEKTRRKEKTRYLKNIKRVKMIFGGSVKKLLLVLNREMKQYVRRQAFEEAIEIRNKIKRFERLIHNPGESEEGELKGIKAADRLRDIIKDYFPFLKKIRRIECYDVSNLGEKNPTASMVVALDGLPDKSQYRRFRIKNPNFKDDFIRLADVMERRLKHDWPLPDLILVDGGYPQVRAVIDVVLRAGKEIPVVGIAKNPDRLVIKTDYIKTVSPDLSDAGFNLVRLLRDESHRFARRYHLYLRKKDFLL